MQPVEPDRQSKARKESGSIGSFRIFGVPIRFHFTFVLLVVFLLFLGLTGQQSAAMNVVYILALFGSVLLHELGHALVARRHDVKTLEIVLYPIGGIARPDRRLQAREELWIAIAGPAVNLAIGAAILGYLYSSGQWIGMKELMEAKDSNLLQRIALGNLILAIFNLLPAYPMDGGRVLRSIVARFRSEDDATLIAARTGRILAGFIGLYGLLSMNFMLLFIAFFVYLGASQESTAVEGRSLTHGFPIHAAMITDFRTLSHGASVRDAGDLLIATSQQDFPVMLGDRVTGLLTRTALIKALVSDGPDAYVSGVMDREYLSFSPEDDLGDALARIAENGPCALVMRDDRLVGLLTAENISEFLLLRRIGWAAPGQKLKA